MVEQEDSVEEEPRALRSAERRLRVFVSSVTEGLREVRHQIGLVIEDMGMEPWIFEETPASSEPLEDSYLRHVPESAFFIWLVGETTSDATANEVRLAIDSPGTSLLVIELDAPRRDAVTEELLTEVRGLVRTVRAQATRENCAEVARASLQDELTRAKRRENEQKLALHQLPAAPSYFINREDEIQSVRGVLETGEGRSRSVIVSGMGGVGKSVLALFAAHGLSDEFDAQLYVDLRTSEDRRPGATDVVGDLLRTLGVPGKAIPSELADATRLLTTALGDRRCLIVLDNASDASQVRPVVAANGDGLVIVTSRDPLLEVEGSTSIPLHPFTHDTSVGLLRLLVGDERVDADPEAARAIAAQCGDLPLALRLAGARLASRPAWQLGDLANLLRDEQQKLKELDRPEIGLRSSFNLSYRELTSAQRHLFCLGALFASDFDVEPAAALIDQDVAETRRCAEDLVDAGLLLARGIARYRYHLLVRAFARDRLQEEFDPAERVKALGRLGAWYAAAADQYSKMLSGKEADPDS